MQILAKGRALRAGIFSFHSCFESVLNFKSEEDHLISIVNPTKGAGAKRIVVDDFSFLKKSEDLFLKIDKNLFELSIFSRPEMKIVFQTELESIPWGGSTISCFDLTFFKSKLSFLERFLVKNAPQKSLFFLMDEKRIKNLTSSFEKVWVESMKSAYSFVGKKSISDVLCAFKGKGIGLTPSGDDFNLGFLTALCLQKLSGPEYFVLARGENIFVNNFLTELEQGFVNEKVAFFLSSFDKSDGVLQDAALDICSQGETSGADWLMGFISGFSVNGGRPYVY